MLIYLRSSIRAQWAWVNVRRAFGLRVGDMRLATVPFICLSNSLLVVCEPRCHVVREEYPTLIGERNLSLVSVRCSVRTQGGTEGGPRRVCREVQKTPEAQESQVYRRGREGKGQRSRREGSCNGILRAPGKRNQHILCLIV